MPVYRTEKEYFLSKIENSTEIEKYPEMNELLKEHTYDEEFHNLCRTFINIPLNAPKFVDNEKLILESIFQYSDINKAKETTQNFINTFSIQNIEELLAVIKLFYSYSFNYKSQKLINVSGKLYDPCEIPDEFWKKLLQDLTNIK